jgi:hypothetical protein
MSTSSSSSEEDHLLELSDFPITGFPEEGNIVPGRPVLVQAPGFPSEWTAATVYTAFPYLPDAGLFALVYRMQSLCVCMEELHRLVVWQLNRRWDFQTAAGRASRDMSFRQVEFIAQRWFQGVQWTREWGAMVTIVESNRLRSAEEARRLRYGAGPSFERTAAELVINRVVDIGLLIDEIISMDFNLLALDVPRRRPATQTPFLVRIRFLWRILLDFIHFVDVVENDSASRTIDRYLRREQPPPPRHPRSLPPPAPPANVRNVESSNEDAASGEGFNIAQQQLDAEDNSNMIQPSEDETSIFRFGAEEGTNDVPFDPEGHWTTWNLDFPVARNDHEVDSTDDGDMIEEYPCLNNEDEEEEESGDEGEEMEEGEIREPTLRRRQNTR